MSLRPTKRVSESIQNDTDEHSRGLPKTIHSPSPRYALTKRRMRQHQASWIEQSPIKHFVETMSYKTDRKLKTFYISSFLLAGTTFIFLSVANYLPTLKGIKPIQVERMHRRPTALNSGLIDEQEIMFPASPLPSELARQVYLPPNMTIYDKVNGLKPDHGGLDIRLLVDTSRRQERRSIYVDFMLDRGYEDLKPVDNDWTEGYYAFDDDVARNPLAMWEDDTIQDKRRCRRTSWHRELHPNCNHAHEYDALRLIRDDSSKLVGFGAFRVVFLSSSRMTNLEDSTALKILKFDLEFNYETYESMRMDALVSEKFTWSSRIVDIFGFCGVSILAEGLKHGDLLDLAVPTGGYLTEPRHEKDKLQDHSPFSPEKKLELALDMVEAVALLHSYPGGVIVHDDIQLTQFLFTGNGSLKLNDFNRAEIMLFDEENQEYCRYRNNPGMGDWRSPEEYDNKPLDEKIDVWSLGNNMYSILTGLFPFYEFNDVTLIPSLVQRGITGHIDQRFIGRSNAEARLVEAIKLCWEQNPEHRIDIFQLRDLLRKFVSENRHGRESPLLHSMPMEKELPSDPR